MKKNNNKIVSLKELNNYVEEQKARNNKVVLCQGHFNVIHPGHLRFLEFAKQHGKCLIVAIQGDNWIEDKVKDIFFSQEERARGVASLEEIDKVIIFNDININDVIETVKPDIYVRGEEFNKRLESVQLEVNLVEKLGGKVVFSSGQVSYASTEFLDQDLIDINEQNKQLFKLALKKQKISLEKLNEYCSIFKKLNILVIGDTIVDQYIACDALGMSSEAPVLAIRELESKEFVGGAAVVARHISALGANCSFISVTGNDEPGKFVDKKLKEDNINTHLFIDNDRQTTFKIRYMVGKQKILRVSRLQDHHINKKREMQIINCIKTMADKLDGIIVSDFAYGVITPGLLENINQLAIKHDIKLFGDSQSSSQIGDVSKFINFDLITPTEREARIALSDKYSGLEQIGNILLEKTKVKNLVITLAENGFISFQNISKQNITLAKTQHFPALAVNPVDVVGAGDSLLTGLSISLCAGASLMEASIIAAGVASIAVNKVGNIPVRYEEVKNLLNSMQSSFAL